MPQFDARLERIDAQFNRINIDADGNGEGDLVDTTEFDCETPEEALARASDWGEHLIFDVLGKDGIPHARHPWKFLSVSAFGNNYGLGHATRRYIEGGIGSGLGGYAIFVNWKPE